ncbi:universal stress protein [Agromyces sp. H3Y2-19a]|jgi:nucleotide-binding universal stress UspA family protein|uniref:universal stress protein n=1 Tax=Agromyces TaxID=33877 RepID=UPI001E2CC574|nr:MULTISPECIES: universal stress protein [Agromyces]MCD5348255.1 universal stress protein [Agromyces sp. S2-1-8]MDF0514140.1 universal stress protein [Agromyces chromiiresistens]
MFTRIIVGWNGAPEAEAALDWALRRGDRLPIVLLHVLEDPDSRFNEERVEAVLARHGSRERWNVETRVVEGAPEQVLAEQVRPGSLVVVGAPAHKRGSRWSLAARLAGRHGGGTVAVVPPGPPPEDGRPVVIGIDGSAAALAAVEVAADEARLRGAPLEIVHAWHPPSTWTPVFGEVTDDLEVFESMHRRALDEAVGRARELGAECSGRLHRADAAQLLDELGASASAVVVASHGYGRIRRFFLGSVSVMLLLDPPCPVLVVTEVVPSAESEPTAATEHDA